MWVSRLTKAYTTMRGLSRSAGRATYSFGRAAWGAQQTAHAMRLAGKGGKAFMRGRRGIAKSYFRRSGAQMREYFSGAGFTGARRAGIVGTRVGVAVPWSKIGAGIAGVYTWGEITGEGDTE